MQFFALILLNIAMFVIFYLVISLKLERKATEFREKKLRRVMDEMINEFNETAERNITILENRISVMKRIMRHGGELKSFDAEVFDSEPEFQKAEKNDMEQEGVLHVTAPSRSTVHSRQLKASAAAVVVSVKNGAWDLISKFKNTVIRKLETSGKLHAAGETRFLSSEDGIPMDVKTVLDQSDFSIKKDYTDLSGMPVLPPSEPDFSLKNEELAGLFQEADDKYALVGDLYGKGYPVELISRASGIPLGEIRLVLNLGI